MINGKSLEKNKIKRYYFKNSLFIPKEFLHAKNFTGYLLNKCG